MNYPDLIGTGVPKRVSLSAASLRRMTKYLLAAGILARHEVEELLAKKNMPDESVATGIEIERERAPTELLESSKPEEEVLQTSGAEGIVLGEPEKPLRARVESVGATLTRCTVYLRGIPLPVAFPTSVIRYHDLAEGSDFDWFRVRGKRVASADIKPVRYDPVVSDE